MYVDKENELSDGQAVTASAVSENVIDFGAPSIGDIGNAEYLNLVVQVDTAVTAAGAATVTFQWYTHSTATVTSGSILAQSDAIGKATLVAGYKAWDIRIPRGSLRYGGLYYSVATGPLTAGAFSAFITPAVQANL